MTSVIEALVWLQDQAGQDEDVQILCITVQENLGCTLAEMAKDEPESLIALYEAVVDLLEQAPLEDTVEFRAPEHWAHSQAGEVWVPDA